MKKITGKLMINDKWEEQKEYKLSEKKQVPSIDNE